MSLADVPWNQFNPYNHFPDGQDFPYNIYHLTPPFAFLSHGLSDPSDTHHNSYAPLDMAALSPEELERFQKLSNEFEPDAQVRESRSMWNRASLMESGSSRVGETIERCNCGRLCKCRSDSRLQDKRMQCPIPSFSGLI